MGSNLVCNHGNNHVYDYKQLLDEVFAISGIIKFEVTDISRSRGLRLITLTGKQNNGKQFVSFLSSSF